MKNFSGAIKKRSLLCLMSALMAIATAFPALASSGPAVVTSADWSSVLTAMTSQISVSTVVGVLAACVTVGIGLVFMWWGVRKLARMLMAAFKKGKLSI